MRITMLLIGYDGVYCFATAGVISGGIVCKQRLRTSRILLALPLLLASGINVISLPCMQGNDHITSLARPFSRPLRAT